MMEMETIFDDTFAPLAGDLFSDLGGFPLLDDIDGLTAECDATKEIVPDSLVSSPVDIAYNIQDHHSHLDETWLDAKVDLLALLSADGLEDETPLALETVSPAVLATLESLSQQAVENLDTTDKPVDPSPNAENPVDSASSILDLLSEGIEIGDLTLPDVHPSVLSSPMSPEDVESILSAPSSPQTIASESSYSPRSDEDVEDYHIGPLRTKRGRTSGRNKADKKTRKMEQNKAAALRYRQKKRAESELVDAELAELESKNSGLKAKVESMTREIQYLKDLMAEVYETRRQARRH